MPRTREDLRRHLLERLLPLWSERGTDPATGLFLYHLDREGRPAENPERRLRVQARQTWAFARAAALGAGPWALDTARGGFERLLRYFRDPEHGGFWLMTTPDGEPLERSKEAYEHAFVVLAAAAYHAASGDPRARATAEEVWSLLEDRLGDPEHGGFFDGADEAWRPRREPRRQNPHMHLLEAALAWAEVDPGGPWLGRADALRGLFDRFFFDPSAGILAEYFTTDWRRAPPPAGDVVEPGHHFEWVFLLAEHDRLRGRAPSCAAAEALFAWASRYGVDPRGGVYDEVRRDGRVARATKRVWPQTEYVRALLVRNRGLGDERARSLASAQLDFLLDRYALPSHGGFMEQLDGEGRIASGLMHATTVYHVLGAFAAAMEML